MMYDDVGATTDGRRLATLWRWEYPIERSGAYDDSRNPTDRTGFRAHVLQSRIFCWT